MRNAGFTLIELMIAVAILAIVAAVALPLYNQYTKRTYRTEAQSDLLDCAQGMERFAAENFNYDGAVLANVCTPRSVAQNRYDFALNVPTPDTFTITATPKNSMAGTGALTVDDAGVRQWDADNNGAFDPGEQTWEE